MTISPNIETDRLIHQAHDAVSNLDWTLDVFGDRGVADALDTECDALNTSRLALQKAVANFSCYSDGRPIRTGIEIEGPGHYYFHLWPAEQELGGERFLFRGERSRNGPDDDTGMFEIYADPRACTLRVELLPPRPFLEVVQ